MIAYRGGVLHCLANPQQVGELQSYEYFVDGVLLLDQGRVKAVGPATDILANLPPDLPVKHYEHALITPGFIDCHIHYPQTEMIASYGEQLLTWLQQYTFPTEEKFADKVYADAVVTVFLQELLRNGTTSALVFATAFDVSVDALFEQAQQLNMRLITGKVLSDRYIPEALSISPKQAYKASKALIEKWHGVQRLSYAVLPRFAVSCSDKQLQRVRKLLDDYPDIYLHTHIAENHEELALLKQLYPDKPHYTAVFEDNGLLGPRSVFAHGVHLTSEELQCFAHSGSKIAFCPSSNLFLGSGLFSLQQAQAAGVDVGLGSDIGAGTSFSLLANLGDAYKIGMLQQEPLPPLQAFYQATLGGAKALDMADKVGNFAIGKEADFVVLDLQATPLLNYRHQFAKDIKSTLFYLMMLGDDRVVQETYLYGKLAYQR